MDIEGSESELVPAIEWSSIRKLVIELHPKTLGRKRIDELTSLLGEKGFVESRMISSTRKKYFERGSSRPR